MTTTRERPCGGGIAPLYQAPERLTLEVVALAAPFVMAGLDPAIYAAAVPR